MLRRAVSLAVSRKSRPDELLMVERSPKLRYFGAFHAFPGGTLDSEDGLVSVEGLEDEALAPFIVAGARELFEETGLLLSRGETRPPMEVLQQARRALLEGKASFASVLEGLGRYLDARDFAPLCRMTTPPFSPVHFDTQFLRATVDDGARVEIWDGELVRGEFFGAASALQKWRAGRMHVAPPMVVLLEEWTEGQDGLEQRVRSLTDGYARGKLHRIYFSPGILLVPLRTPTRPPATHTNTLVIGEKSLFVVDPSPRDATEQERFWDLLDELVSEGRELEGILLTHYHPDHVGALAQMQRRYDVLAFAHRECMTRLPGTRFGRALDHGDSIEIGNAPDGEGDWKLCVYHVPGHAPGHLAFQETRYGSIVVGDLVSTLSSILIDPSDGHLATYLKSLSFLETVTTGALYPGHGPPVLEGREVVRKTIEHRRQREEQLLEALTRDAQSPGELVAKIYTDVDPEMHALAERSLLSGLMKLEEEGRVVRSEGGYSLAG
ncbi:MAG TPA: MBL fold metallo-hydrolase [Vicinamibacteria bacterium]|nr:MBL fold metallo-hydrolase [Vicinamibacteria bacterium]